jgi:hypothetical protein
MSVERRFTARIFTRDKARGDTAPFARILYTPANRSRGASPRRGFSISSSFPLLFVERQKSATFSVMSGRGTCRSRLRMVVPSQRRHPDVHRFSRSSREGMWGRAQHSLDRIHVENLSQASAHLPSDFTIPKRQERADREIWLNARQPDA